MTDPYDFIDSNTEDRRSGRLVITDTPGLWRDFAGSEPDHPHLNHWVYGVNDDENDEWCSIRAAKYDEEPLANCQPYDVMMGPEDPKEWVVEIYPSPSFEGDGNEKFWADSKREAKATVEALMNAYIEHLEGEAQC